MSGPATSESDVFMEVSADLLRRGYRVRFRADGRSMHPAIRNGDTITVAPAPPRLSDIVVYHRRGRVVAHRVVSIDRSDRDENAFVLRGDAMSCCDAPVASTQVIGKVIAVDRHRRALRPGRRARHG